MQKIYALALVSLLGITTGCGNSGSPVTPPPTTPTTPAATSALYTETNATTGNQVLAYSRGSSGALTSIGAYSTGGVGTGLPTVAGNLPFPVGGATGAVTLNAAGTFLYAVDAGSNDVAAFSVATDGTLTFIANYPTSNSAPGSPTSPASITIDSTGKYLYVLNTGTLPNEPLGVGNPGGGGITGFTIGTSGALTPIPNSTQPLSTGLNGAYVDPSEVAFSPDGTYLMVTEKLSGTVPGSIDIYPVTAGVAGTPVTTAANDAIPFGFGFTSSGVAVVANVVSLSTPLAGTVTSYTATSKGVVTVVNGGSSVADLQTAPCWIALNPAGTVAYAVNTLSGSISSYTVSSTGALTLSSSTAASIGASSGPIDVVVSPNNAYLYVIQSNAGHSPGQILGYSIGTGGALTSITTGATGLPEGSLGLAIR